MIYNNQPGKDAELLKQFGEPAWNYQVIRFLNEEGTDVIPRKDRVWSLDSVAARMVEALQAADAEIPPYLEALSGRKLAANVGSAAFAMFCFWTGEMKLGGLEGVLTTEAGWFDGREVTLVTFDRDRLPFATLLSAAMSYECAQKVFTSIEEDRALVSASRLSVGELTDDYRPARISDQKRQLNGTPYAGLDLSPVQATKVNAFARVDSLKAKRWLSPSQLKQVN